MTQPIFEGTPEFNTILMSRIEKADQRIGLVSLENAAARLQELWDLRHV